MNRWSAHSLAQRETLDPRLQQVADAVLLRWDCRILEGHRGESAQNHYFETGRSKLKFPDSEHNATPSRAMDLAPVPIDWDDLDRWRVFVGFVLGTAAAIGVRLRSGLDWDGDRDFSDQSFNDFPHFELIDD